MKEMLKQVLATNYYVFFEDEIEVENETDEQVGDVKNDTDEQVSEVKDDTDEEVSEVEDVPKAEINTDKHIPKGEVNTNENVPEEGVKNYEYSPSSNDDSKTKIDPKLLSDEKKKMRELISGLEKLSQEYNSANPDNGIKDDLFKWIKNSTKYGDFNYKDGKSLNDITHKHTGYTISSDSIFNSAEKAFDKEFNFLNKKINQLLISLSKDKDETFEIVTNPCPEQVQQLKLLSTYFHLTTGIEIPNHHFIYNSFNSEAINIKRLGLGVNSLILKHSSFYYAQQVYLHERTHNDHYDHSTDFIDGIHKYSAEIHKCLDEVLNQKRGTFRSKKEEELIRKASKHWEDLQKMY